MIIVNLKGGLGNQMFQFAMGYSVAMLLRTDYLFDSSSFKYDQLRNIELEEVFNVEAPIATDELIQKIKLFNPPIIERIKRKIFNKEIPYYKKSFITEVNFSYDKNLKNISKDCYLDGYFQSEKYFEEYQKDINLLFQFKNPPNLYYSDIFKLIEEKESVSIHIRRGDYVANPEANSFHGLTTLEYYKQAIDLVSKKIKHPFFIVISDDIEWCKTEFDFVDCFFVENGRGKDYEDLRLMTKCQHNIIANSSFSWWGAWLNQNPEKIVIAPKIWFLNEEFQSQTQDLKPKTWIQL